MNRLLIPHMYAWWDDNIREWTGLELAKSQRAVENRGKMEETGCEIICAAPTTLAVKKINDDDDDICI